MKIMPPVADEAVPRVRALEPATVRVLPEDTVVLLLIVVTDPCNKVVPAIVEPRVMLGEEATARVANTGAWMLCELPDLLGKVFRRSANRNQVLNAAFRPVCDPVDEFVILPQ